MMTTLMISSPLHLLLQPRIFPYPAYHLQSQRAWRPALNLQLPNPLLPLKVPILTTLSASTLFRQHPALPAAYQLHQHPIIIYHHRLQAPSALHHRSCNHSRKLDSSPKHHAQQAIKLLHPTILPPSKRQLQPLSLLPLLAPDHPSARPLHSQSLQLKLLHPAVTLSDPCGRPLAPALASR